MSEQLDPLTAEELTDLIGRHAKAMLARCMEGPDRAEEIAFRAPDGRRMVLSVCAGSYAEEDHDAIISDPDGIDDDEPVVP
jgi:hypothetical protein